MRRILFFIPLLIGALFAIPGPCAQLGNGGEILWDEFGIPHIYGKDLLAVLRGYGYAQMENHAELILQKVAQARGRSAEYFGPGDQNANVTSDIRVRTFGIPARADRWYRDGGIVQRALIQAFADGINEYAENNAASIDARLRQVLPFTPQDVLILTQYTVQFTFLLQNSGVPDLLASWQSASATSSIRSNEQPARPSSNGWAVAPARSAGGNSLLMGNPHLPWGVNQPVPGLDIFQFVEANLVVGNPEHPLVNAYGATFPGSPFIAIGFNDYLGWTHTVNPIKNADLYELTLLPGGYQLDGSVRPFSSTVDSIKILQPDGSYITQNLTILSSVHGPVVAQKGNKALALRVAGLDAASLVTQYWGMTLARNLAEFNLANSALQMPIFNVVYGDRDGHIMYLFGGLQPVRSGGTYQDWAGILPGNTSSTLWTSTLPWHQLPKTSDTPGGFVSNSNEPPWFATFPQTIRQTDFPSYIAPAGTFFRPQAGSLFLQSQPRFTADDLQNGNQSTHLLFADRVLDDLIAAARASGDSTATAAANVLSQWNRNSDASDSGAVLFEDWYQAYMSDPASPRSPVWGSQYPAFRVEWSDADPLDTPVGLADPPRSVTYLVTAANQLLGQFGRLDVLFGDVHRIVLVGYDQTFQNMQFLTNTPASGLGDPFGALRALYYFPVPDAKQEWVYFGPTYTQLVEFTKAGPEAQALLSYGNASRPGSQHITDQLSLFNAKQLRPVYRTPDDVKRHAVRSEVF